MEQLSHQGLSWGDMGEQRLLLLRDMEADIVMANRAQGVLGKGGGS